MIVVLLGTNPYPFNRLLKAVDEWASATGERVVAQVGHTRLPVAHVECHDFVPHDRIVDWLSRADLAISQGGFGSLRDCLRAGKPTIAVPRRPELGECQDVQTEVVYALAADERLVVLENMEDLARTIEDARRMNIRPIETSRIPDIVAGKISEIFGNP